MPKLKTTGGATDAYTSPTVSIGMPVYNGAKYIREALDSLLAQTFVDFELIISDNASTDSTPDICREYVGLDARIRYVRQHENLGAAENFKFVLSEAKGACFMWAAHDDEWMEDYLTEAMLLLSDASTNFIFPTFLLKSIRLGFKKEMSEEIFRFVEATDRKERVLQFLNLHHYSCKCNIVYSLFKREFLINATMRQDISNDGVLGAVILGLGGGKILHHTRFSKRYPWYWPGMLKDLHYCFHKKGEKTFALAKVGALIRLKALFPEYSGEISSIFDSYHRYKYYKHYRIRR